MAIPRTVDELLESLPDYRVVKAEDIITENVWTRRFMEYLRKKKLEDEETTLRFLVMSQPYLRNLKKLRESNNNNKRHMHIQQDQAQMFRVIAQRFFSEESETIVCLNNDTLFNAIVEACTKKGSLDQSDFDLLERATKDHDVRTEGLDPVYMRFAEETSPSAIACLLSIL